MLQSTLHKPLKDNFGRVCALVLFFLLTFTLANAQTTSPTDGSTPLGLSPGSPSGSYSLSGFESVSPYNGNLNFHLPLVGIGGRGGAGTSSVLAIDTKGWTVRHQETTDPYGNPVDVYTPVANPWVPKPGYGPGVLVGRQSGDNPTQVCQNPGGGITRYIYSQTLTRLTFTTGDGTEYEFRDQLTAGQPATVSNPCGSGASRGTVFVTADGTAATFVSDSIIYDKIQSKGASMIFPSGYLMLRDGTRYRIDGGGVTWLRDRNGNKLTFSYNGGVATITDSLNRQVTYTYADFVNTFSDQITVKGFGGATRTILVNYSQLANALRTTNPRNEPASRYQLQTYHGLFPELNNASSYSTWNPWVVTSVTLPNNQQYQFLYNCFAEVARINLPTSGAIEYDYTAGSGAISDGTDYQVYRRVKERRVYPDGSNLESYTTYSEPTYGNTAVVFDHLSASGTLLSRDKHYFYGSALDSLFNSTGISYPTRIQGREYQSEAYGADGTTLLRRSQTTWVNRAPVSWWYSPGDVSEPPNDPRVTDTTSTLADVSPNLVSKHTFGYDDSVPFNNRNDIKEFGFGNGTPGALLRETTTSFVTSSTYTGTSVHLRSLPLQVSVYDAGGVERARTTYEYDNYTTDANHASLANQPNISGFDSSFNTSYLTRGNATASTSYLLTNGSVTSSVSGYAQYDIAGNVLKTIDALGHVTTFYFSDCFGAPDGNAHINAGSQELNAAGQYSYALVTSVTRGGQTSFLQYDYYLGRPVDAEDANGTIYTGYSNDVLDRPTQIVSAINNASLKSQSTFSYDDTNRTVTVTRDKDAYGDNLLKGVSFYDGLGRTIESRTYENSTDYITMQQRPFVMRQDPDTGAWVAATESSNPYRSYLGEVAVWTTTFSDALGRATKVRTPDSAIARTSYSGNTVTVSDQTGKARKSVSDAFGRLTQVNEDPNGVNYATTYAYDVLNNLLTISQGTQTRTFVYDSLKRLTSTTNPENGTVNNTYDNGGNLLVTTDARGVSTHLAYDELNRATRRWYNGSSSTTATTNNSPALPSGVGTSSEANFYYDAQSLPSGAPSFTRGSSTGRLVAVTYGGSGSSAGDYFGYDALGRDVLKIQQTGGVNYQTTAGYSIGGALNSETYPSVRTVNYGYDGAGRTSSFSGNLGDGVTRTYSTGIVYSSLGGMTKEQFGTDTAVYNKLFYDVRGQLSEIRESTSYTGPTDTNWNRGAIINHYSECWGMCGGSNSTTPMTDNNGNLKKQEVYVPGNDQITSYTTWWQRYDYDSLNRLQRVAEITGNSQTDWQQEYVNDRYGNRTIHQTNTWGNAIPKPNFTVDANTNRLTAPTPYAMTYDSAGNLTNDTYSGQGQRTYDAENRMTQAWANNQWQTYTYDASGQRVRRNVNGVETWAMYGLGGELLAEYAASALPASPQKEYGYRNGQLLITAEAPAATSATFVQTDTTTQGNWKGVYGSDGYNVINDAVSYPSYAQVSVSGQSASTWAASTTDARALRKAASSTDRLAACWYQFTNFTVDVNLTDGNTHQVAVYSLDWDGNNVRQERIEILDAGTNGILDTRDVTSYSGGKYSVWSLRGHVKIKVSHLSPAGSNAVISGLFFDSPQHVSWTNAVGVSISGNSVTKTAATAWGNGGAASSQSIVSGDGYVEFTATELNSDRICGLSNGDANQDWTDIDFGLYMRGDGYASIVEFGTYYGNIGVPISTGDVLRVSIEGGVVKYRKNGTVFYTSSATATYPLRVDTAFYQTGSTLANVVLSGNLGGSATANINWLVTDQLGTPRLVFDKTGALATVKRHDYLPFGEELSTGQGTRTTTLGYGAADGVRQKFTSQERDNETGLDYMHARYFASAQGRFTSADTFGGSTGNPQSLNRYAYVGNNPMNFSDPTGHDRFSASSNGFAEAMGDEGGGYMSPENPDYDPESILSDNVRGDMHAWEQRNQNTRDSIAAREALADNDFDTLNDILKRNQNVGVSVNGHAFYGELATAFISGYSQPIEIAQLRGFPPGAPGYAVRKGLEAVARLVQKARKPDFYVFNAAGMNAQGSVAVTRGCTFTISLGVTVGNVASLMAGWLLQLDKPNDEDVVGFLTGRSGGADIFWNPKTGLGAGVGAGFIRSSDNPGTRWAVTLGLGLGGGFSGGYGWAPDWRDLTRRYFP